MNKPLEVDAFGIDIETLVTANKLVSCRGSNIRQARAKVAEAVIKALDIDSKKRFEEYQEQNDPCR